LLLCDTINLQVGLLIVQDFKYGNEAGNINNQKGAVRMVTVLRQRKGEQPEVIGRVDGEALLDVLYKNMPTVEGLIAYTFRGSECSKGCDCSGCGSVALCKDKE
jgi:hypothetical protein